MRVPYTLVGDGRANDTLTNVVIESSGLSSLQEKAFCMVGVLAIGKKAATFGYKRYGLPGAIMAGGATAAGYIVIKRALRSEIDQDSVTSAINTDEIKSVVEEKGLDAVREKDTLESAIEEDELESAVEIDVVQSTAEEEVDELTETTEATNEDHGDEHSDEEESS